MEIQQRIVHESTSASAQYKHWNHCIENFEFKIIKMKTGCRCTVPGFLRCFRDPIRVPRIENRIPRIGEIGSLQVDTGNVTFSLKKPGYTYTLMKSLLGRTYPSCGPRVGHSWSSKWGGGETCFDVWTESTTTAHLRDPPCEVNSIVHAANCFSARGTKHRSSNDLWKIWWLSPDNDDDHNGLWKFW